MASSWLKMASRCLSLASSWLKLASSWVQVRPGWLHAGTKWRQKSIHENMPKNITFRVALNSIFARFRPPRWPPREGQNFHFWGVKTILEPTWPLGSPRGSPGYPQDRFREPRRPIWVTFSSILERMLNLGSDRLQVA